MKNVMQRSLPICPEQRATTSGSIGSSEPVAPAAPVAPVLPIRPVAPTHIGIRAKIYATYIDIILWMT